MIDKTPLEIGGISPQYQKYERQKCFVGHSHEAAWRDDILSACAEVLPKFDLEPWYAADHFDPTQPLRDKVVELIANARYGIYDLSNWQDGRGEWHLPRNVFIELGMAIVLNRPTLLLRHTSNTACPDRHPLPACLEGIELVEFSGEATLKDALIQRLPQWFKVPPDRDWLNRFCIFGNRVCGFREDHPRARQWGQETLRCHVSDGLDECHPSFQHAERREIREVFEGVFSRYNDLKFDYLDELSLTDGYQFILCTHCQTIRSTPFAIYRILPEAPAEIFIAIGMSIALETLFDYKIPKVLLVKREKDLPSLLRGYEVVEAVNSSEAKRKLSGFIPKVIQKVRETSWKPRPLPFVETIIPRDMKHRTEDELDILEEIKSMVDREISDSKDLLNYILNRCLGLTGASFGSIMLREGEELKAVASTNLDVQSISRKLSIVGSVSGRALTTGEPIIASDLRAGEFFIDAIQPAIKSLILVPILSNNWAIGVLNLGSETLNAFNERHVNLLESLSKHVAIVLSNILSETEVINRVAQLFMSHGAKVDLSAKSDDSGIDMLAYFDKSKHPSGTIAIQVKTIKQPVGLDTVRAFNTAIERSRANKQTGRCIIVSVTGFSDAAYIEAKETGLELLMLRDLEKYIIEVFTKPAVTQGIKRYGRKIRVYDLAKELKLENKRIIDEARRQGIDVVVPSNTIPIEVADRIREKYYPRKAKPGTGPRLVKDKERDRPSKIATESLPSKAKTDPPKEVKATEPPAKAEFAKPEIAKLKVRKLKATPPLQSSTSALTPKTKADIAEPVIDKRPQGTVIETLENTLFRVRIDEGQEVLARLSKKMRENFIKITQGDRVTVDLTNRRIIYRHRS